MQGWHNRMICWLSGLWQSVVILGKSEEHFHEMLGGLGLMLDVEFGNTLARECKCFDWGQVQEGNRGRFSNGFETVAEGWDHTTSIKLKIDRTVGAGLVESEFD